MRILIVTNYYHPSPSAASKRIANYVKALELEQNEVRVLTICLRSASWYLDIILSFLLPFISFWKTMRFIKNIDVIYIYGFGWVSQWLILLAARSKQKKVGIEVCELPYSIIGSRRDSILKFLYPVHHKFLIFFVYRHIDGFIVISESLSEYVRKYKKSDAVVCKIPILVDYDYYQTDIPEPDCSKPFTLHAALINNHKDGIFYVYEALGKLISEKNINVHIYFTKNRISPQDKRKIDEIVNKYKIDQFIHLLGDLDESALKSYQKYSSFVIINKVNSLQNRYNFSTKLGEYLALGVPIITTRVGEINNYLIDKESCIFVDCQDVELIVESIHLIMSDLELREKIIAKGKFIAKSQFDIRSNSRSINSFFLELLEKFN